MLTFAPGAADFDADALQRVAIGPSGNLRAPTVRAGTTWWIGFHEAAYGELCGA